ncbi:MAG: ATP-dependent helicase RecG [Actinomycetota bacterium]|nr:ATP-dependent helicase RecG [Actinomycetota bacterium]
MDRLGKTGVASARNGHLLRICQNVRSKEDNRVVEALASGIPAVLASLRDADMVPPRFHDQGISFTVAVPNHALLAADDLEWLAALPAAATLSDRQRHAFGAMRHGRTWTNQTFRETFPMDSREARAEPASAATTGSGPDLGASVGPTRRNWQVLSRQLQRTPTRPPERAEQGVRRLRKGALSVNVDPRDELRLGVTSAQRRRDRVVSDVRPPTYMITILARDYRGPVGFGEPAP